MHPTIKTMRSTAPSVPDLGTYEVGQTIFFCAHRDPAPPWKYQEFVCFKVKVERTTEKAVLLVDAISKSRRSTWVPKSLLARAKKEWDGTVTHSYLLGNKLENEAGFSVDAIYNNEGGSY
jgi:hypothetical protein